MNEPFVLHPRWYDFLKWVALVLLPALSALYVGVGSLWNFGAIPQVVGSLTLLDTFLGVILNKSSKNYMETQVVGDLIVKQDIDGNATGIQLSAFRDPLILDADNRAIFNVRRQQDL